MGERRATARRARTQRTGSFLRTARRDGISVAGAFFARAAGAFPAAGFTVFAAAFFASVFTGAFFAEGFAVVFFAAGFVATFFAAGFAAAFVAAGPTTSIREEPYEAQVIEQYGVRGVIGKGGMGPRTLEALRKHGCVYIHAIGGLAVVLAQKVVQVKGVHMLDELGVPEAMWSIEVKDFPSVITMDSHGDSLHEKMFNESRAAAEALMQQGVRKISKAG